MVTDRKRDNSVRQEQRQRLIPQFCRYVALVAFQSPQRVDKVFIFNENAVRKLICILLHPSWLDPELKKIKLKKFTNFVNTFIQAFVRI